MNKNVMIVLAGGFIIAILVAVLVQASLGGKKSDDGGEKVQVLVAAKDLGIGSELNDGDLKWQTWPGNAFQGAIVRKTDEEKASEALKGRLIAKVSSGQPVLQSYVFKEGKGNVVAATLEKGMRAVSISVKADTMAGGFVSPGDFVDVILTYRVEVQREERTMETSSFLRSHASETILKNVKVLAVDQESSRDEDKAKIAKTITIAVDTKGAEKVALASEMGDLILTLRGIGDDKDDNTAAMTTDIEVSKAMQNIVNMRTGGTGAGPVRIYSGAAVSEVRPRGAISSMQFDDETIVESSEEVEVPVLSEPTEGEAE